MASSSTGCENGVVEYLRYNYNIELRISPLPAIVDSGAIKVLSRAIDAILVATIDASAPAEVDSAEVSVQHVLALRTHQQPSSSVIVELKKSSASGWTAGTSRCCSNSTWRASSSTSSPR